MLATRPDRLIAGRIESPLGAMVAVSDERNVLRGLWFDEPEEASYQQALRRLYGRVPVTTGLVPETIRAALDRYFAGDLAALSIIPWGLAGTAFQQAVWSALAAVPVGATTTYGALAAQIGRPRAVRAVGAANGANPISIVVPCHRVIGTNRTLTGYGGGLHRKRWLLAHEGVLLSEQGQLAP
jgi:methylated-DNA-[protein]-cysteine S-methyltransferase